MTIEFRCAQCQQLLRVPDESAGKNARCPKCQSLMQVPAAPGAPGFGPLPPAPQFGAPTPPAPAQNDPFAFLGGGQGGSNPPPPKNPFGEAAGGGAPNFAPKPGGAPSLNPYASPSGGYAPTQTSGGPRTGLPWETRGQNFSTWWETAKLCMNQPSRAFSMMRLSGGMGSPMLFSGMGLGIGFVGQMLWYIPMMVIMGLAAGDQDAFAAIGIQIVMSVVQGAIGVVAGATIGLLVGAAIMHVCLMIVGGARQQFEATLRALAFAQGSTAWLQVIPIVGPLVGAVWVLVIEVVGLARAHEISTGKAVMAVLLPIVVCCVAIGGIVFLAIGLGAAAGSGAFN